MAVLRRLALDRRTLLRGGAAALALPWLDAMQAALTPPPKPQPRCLFVFSPNGMNQAQWKPKGEGRAAELHGTLAPLHELREAVTVWSGFEIDAGWAHGNGPGDHARAAATFLTCAKPRKTGGTDIEVGVSIDQVIAAQIGGSSPFASLELGMERGTAAGNCDSGYSCAYTNNVSWRSASVPVAKVTDPRVAYTRLFGDPQRAHDGAAHAADRRTRRSVLDLVASDAKALAGKLSAADRRKLEQYCESVRELEQRLDRAEREQPAMPTVDGLMTGGQGYADKLALMYELIALAFATDRTQVATLMLGNGGSNRSYKFLGVPDGHHDLSHHGKKAEKLAALATIDHFQVTQFAKFLRRLRAQRDGDGDLLAHSMVLFGSGLGDGDRHNHDDLPLLLAGGGAGAIKARGHVVPAAKKTPLANLYVAIARAMGVDIERFADSNAVQPLA